MEFEQLVENLNLPVRHKAQEIMDSSAFTSLMTCPRLYFYKNLLGWRDIRPPQDAEFGKAWHKAQEILWVKGKAYDFVEEAFREFNESYRQAFEPGTDEIFEKKNPQAAAEALIAYVEKYGNLDKSMNVLMVEVAGSAPISHSRRIHFRLDTVVEEDGYIPGPEALGNVLMHCGDGNSCTAGEHVIVVGKFLQKGC